MKRIAFKIIIISILIIVDVCAKAQTYYLNGAGGYLYSTPIDSMSVGGTRTKTWYIDTGSQKDVAMYYSIDIVPGIDFVDIYAISGNGSEYQIKTLTGSDDAYISTGLPSGKAKVEFRINSGSAGSNYYGIYIEYDQGSATIVPSEVETSISNNVYVNQNLSALGNVGIGTGSSASCRLQVTGNNYYGIYSSNSNKNGNTYGICSYATNSVSNASVYGIYSYAGSSGSNTNVYGIYSSIYGPSANKWAGYFNGGKVQVNNGDLLITSGKVGIGTTTPQNALDVYGSVYLPANNSYWIGSYSNSGNRLRLHHNGTNAYIDYLPNLYFRADGTTDALTLLQNGNVGIGITNPTQKLEVNGTIRAKEVKIETNWADYVFKDNYLLKPLQEVNEYIKTNKRLPDLPSEQEVKESGVSLGDMQTKLLQKIEELTLYTIQQQEMIDKLNARIEQLEKK